MSRTCYVYVVGWKKLDTWYCGVRYRKGCCPEDLWKLYFTSSKHVARFRIKNGEPDVIRIVRVFGDNAESALEFERRYLRKVNALGTTRWLNRAIGNHTSHGYPLSEETKQKISDAHKGQKRAPASKERIEKQRRTFMKNYSENREERFASRSAKQKGRIITQEARLKIAASLIGRKDSLETKMKKSIASKNQPAESRSKQADALRGRKWFTNGVQVIRSYECPEGFRPGRK